MKEISKAKRFAVEQYVNAANAAGEGISFEDALTEIDTWSDEQKAAIPEFAYGYSRQTINEAKINWPALEHSSDANIAGALDLLDSQIGKDFEGILNSYTRKVPPPPGMPLFPMIASVGKGKSARRERRANERRAKNPRFN